LDESTPVAGRRRHLRSLVPVRDGKYELHSVV